MNHTDSSIRRTSARAAWVAVLSAALILPVLTGCQSRKSSRQARRAPSSVQPYTPPPAETDTYVAPPSMPAPDLPPSSAAAPDSMAPPAFDEPVYEAPPAPPMDRGISDASDERIADLQDKIDELEDRLRNEPPAGAPPPVDWDTPPEVARTPQASSALARDLAAAGLEVSERSDGVVVTVADAFQPGSESLKSDARLVGALRQAARTLSQHDSAQIAVVGHSDLSPIKHSRWASNTELSLARAQTVATVLADGGVTAERIAIDGRGEFEPLVSPERSVADQARNRRVEILIRR